MTDSASALAPSASVDPVPTGTAALARVRVVLVGTSHPGNIGAAARALKTMGLTRLVLVAPRYADAREHPDAVALAAGAGDVLAGAVVYATLHEALAGCHWAVAMTARTREYMPPETNPRAAAQTALAQVTERDAEAALVFGSERYGLDNDAVLACQACCTIPTDPACSSLNLAQAIQVMAYECRLAALALQPAAPKPAAPLATADEREAMLTHLNSALTAIGFLDPAHPKKLDERLRRLFSRCDLEPEEINLLRGICSTILAPRQRGPRQK